MQRELYEFSNEALALAARSADAHDVHQERLIREIMATDDVEYKDACDRMREMFDFNMQRSRLLLLPLHTGLVLAAVAAVGCVPLVFDHELAIAFAEVRLRRAKAR